jgi:hypothetical protein
LQQAADRVWRIARQTFIIRARFDCTEPTMNDQQRLELEAAAFRRLVAHLDSRKDVQNIDLMNLSGFCRNCLSKWYKAAADERQIEVSLDDAREVVYGMPYAEWKAQYQQEANAEQQAAFAKGKPNE